MSGMFSTGALAAIKAILAASTGTAGIGYANDGTPVTLEQGLDLLYRGIADVRNEAYAGGAVGDGVADDAPAFQAAFDSGRIVMARDGTYLLASPISVTLNNAVLMGGGRRTVIKSSSATADIFLIGDGVAEISGVDFSNFRVWASVTKTAGYVFNCRKTTDSRFVNIGAGNIDDYVAAGSTHKLWNGYYFDRFSQVVVSGGEIVVENDGIKARGNADQSFGAELSILGGLRIFKAGGKAVHLGGATGGVYLGRMDISECYRGLYCDDTLQAGVYNREVFLSSELTIDMCTGWGINIESNGLATLESPGAWISGCGNSTTSEGGIRVAPTTGVSVSAKWGALRVQSCYYDGMQLNSGAHALAAPFIRSNGTGATGGHGILIAAGVSGFAMTGGILHDNGKAARGYGIEIGAGADNYSIQGAVLFSNVQGQINNLPGAAPSRIVRANTGYVSENGGQATITTGNTTVTVTHGCSTAPNYPVVSPVGALGVAWGVQNINATTFQIVIASALGANQVFQWSVNNH